MFGRIALSIAIGLSTLTAQSIPDRPEKLTFPELNFQVPRERDFKDALRNRVPVYISHDATTAPIVRLSIMWRGGSYIVPANKEGLAGYFGSLLTSSGSTKMDLDRQEEILESLAASINSNCGSTSGSISMTCMVKDFDQVFEILMNCFLDPAFRQDRLDLAKRNSMRGIETLNDTVGSISSYQMGYLLNGENHFSTRASTPASINSITRDDLLAFHQRILHPQNFVITVTGNFDKKTIMDKLNATVGAMRPSREAEVSSKVPAPEHTRTPGIYVVDKADAPQAQVQWAFPGMRRNDPDWYAATVMNNILGAGGFTSRLTSKIRSDEGLTYGIRSGISSGTHWLGDATGSSQTSNNTVAYLMKLALAEMDKLKNEPVSAKELQDTKDGIISSFPSRWTKTGTVSTFASEALDGLPEGYWLNYREKIQAVTIADVQRVANRLLNFNNIIILAVGNAGQIEAGDVDRPVRMTELLPSLSSHRQLRNLPLRDPNTRRPM